MCIVNRIPSLYKKLLANLNLYLEICLSQRNRPKNHEIPGS